MTDIPENVDLDWIARRLVAVNDDNREMRRDLDILIRLATRIDATLDAVRADLRTLWLAQGDLRRRLESLEEARP